MQTPCSAPTVACAPSCRPRAPRTRTWASCSAIRRSSLYGAKTGTIDSLADIARRKASCQAWNERHPKATQLVCGKAPPDDSLFVIAFGVVTPHGTVPITFGIQLQRGAKGSAAHVTPDFVHAIADYPALARRGARLR